MDTPKNQARLLAYAVLLWPIIFPGEAFAAIDSVGVFNKVLDKFEGAAALWQTVMINHATWLFWLLALLSMVWTFGMMALRKADLGEFFAEFFRFTTFTGFFWWLLLNGPRFAVDVMNSLRMIGAEASGLPNDLGPSGIVDIGFDIFFKVVDLSDILKPIDSLFGLLLSACILVMFALIGTNMLLLLVSGYLFAYAGVFILGFGGARWTSEMAINYYKSILNVALQLMAMVLIVGIGRSFLDQYYEAMDAGMKTKELGIITVVAAVLLFMVAKVPPQIGALAGGSTGNLGSNFGVGAAVGAAAFGAAAVASAGSAALAGAANATGGAQALMAAFSSASATAGARDASGSGISAAISPQGSSASGAESVGGSSGFAQAMGDAPGANNPTSGNSSGVDSTASDVPAARESAPASHDHSSSNQAGGKEDKPSGGAKPATAATSADSPAARAGKIAAGTAINLAQGTWDVAKAKGVEIRDSARERISQTAGGKVASAIKARANAAASGEVAHFGEDSLSQGTQKADAASEIAAFRDRSPKSDEGDES